MEKIEFRPEIPMFRWAYPVSEVTHAEELILAKAGNIDEDELMYHWGSLPVLTPYGFRFLAPIMVSAMYHGINNRRSTAIDSLLSVFEASLMPERLEHQRELQELFSPAEIDEVREVLKHVFASICEEEPWHYVEETMQLWSNDN